jgi:hypothetical protein
VRLVLHTSAYWLMLTVRDAIPKARDLTKAELGTLRLRPIKMAARVVETTIRLRVVFAAYRGSTCANAANAPRENRRTSAVQRGPLSDPLDM